MDPKQERSCAGDAFNINATKLLTKYYLSLSSAQVPQLLAINIATLTYKLADVKMSISYDLVFFHKS